MEKISALIISYNEEKKIGKCLQSLKALADEIVVVDSFSTDGTAQIVKNMGGRFLQHEFEGYIEQKNYALAQASYDLVLSLDADEVLSEPLKQSILKVKEQANFAGYSMNRLTFLEGKAVQCCGWYPDSKLRLFRRSKGQWTGLNPHDEFRFRQKTTLGHLNGDLLHYSFDSKADLIRQTEKFARLSASSYFEEKKNLFPAIRFLSPAFRFVRDYFLKGGIWVGKTGWLVAWTNAKGTFLKYKYLQELKRVNK